jgi:hypothetical protein
MGLLDDAIREHLDLKRARGADPAEVERLEREALGPVRREPTIGAAHYDAPEHLRHPEDLGYHDSTAPHSESYLEQHAPRLDLGGHAQPNGVHAQEEEEQPKRRFLRRSRPASQTDPTPDPEALGAYEHHELPDHLDLPHHDELLEHDEPLEHHELLDHDGVIAHDDLIEHEPPEHEPATEVHEVAEPPHLRFDAPPVRPRFTTEPPAATPPQEQPPTHPDAPHQDAVPADPETAVPAEPMPPASAEPQPAHPDEPATRHHEPQPTHEFDVPSTFRKRAEEAGPETEQGEDDKDEDVLEETPEFLQDTPEHDRLWFEQRPPRDFDFDG